MSAPIRARLDDDERNAYIGDWYDMAFRYADALRAVLDLCDAAEICPADDTKTVDSCDCCPDEYHDRDVYGPSIRRAVAEKLDIATD
jgi:hypothetical protein